MPSAAVAAGGLRVKGAAAPLRRIALDEGEDLATRVGAARSYLQLSGKQVAKSLTALLAAKAWQVRATAYATVMNGESRTLRSVAKTRFARERNAKVRQFVTRRVHGLRTADSTSEVDG